MRLAIVAAICAALASGQEVKRPRLTGVAHIGLYSHDIEKSRAFYTDFLGFQEVFPQKNPDGSRTEAMEPVPADAPLVNSTAPPVR
jgi:lactoylglutathione lyase